jgi:hypothetical protein
MNSPRFATDLIWRSPTSSSRVNKIGKRKRSNLYYITSNNLELSASVDSNLGTGSTRSRTNTFDRLDDIQALGDFAEDNVLSVEPVCLGGADEDCEFKYYGEQVRMTSE